MAERARLEALDLLRGFALLGILLVNILGYAQPFAVLQDPVAGLPDHAWNRGSLAAIEIFASGKFVFLFTMLFGAGLVFFAAKTDADGRPAGTRLWFRRMAVLLVIGLGHGTLLWYGDVLSSYALAGLLVLWWCRNWRPLTTFVVAAGLLTTGMFAIMHLAGGGATEDASAEVLPDESAAWLGPYLDGVALRAGLVLADLMRLPYFLGVGVSYMLLGPGLLRCGVLGGDKSPRFYGGMALVGGVALVASAWLHGRGEFSFLLAPFLAVPIGLGYAGGLLWLWKTDRLGPLQPVLAAVGRMALTNYLLQSLLCALVFYTPGLGLFGQLDYPALLGIVAAVWVINITVSVLWLRRFRYGPAEWVWRAATYGRWPALRRT